MTGLEQAVVNALRLSDDAATNLLPTIQRDISTARAELIRSGISETVASGTGYLVEDAIICFVMAKMSDGDMSERYMNMFMYQQDNLRKS